MKTKKSIKNKLIQLFLIMGITPSLLIMLIMYFGTSSNLEKLSGENQKILAIETSLRVSMYLNTKIESVLKYSSYATIKRMYFPGNIEEMSSQFIRSLFRFDNDLYNISLLDERQKLTFSYRPNIFDEKMLQALNSEISSLEENEVLLMPILNTSIEENNYIEILTPVISDLNKKRLGYLVATINLKSLSKMIKDIPVYGEYYIALIDNSGFVISNTIDSNQNKIVSENMKALFTLGSKGWVIGYDELLKRQSIFGYSEIFEITKYTHKNNKWHIYISRKIEEAFRPIFWLMIKLLAFCIGIILIILIIFIFQIETIWKPIISLKKGAEMIGSGNFDMVLFVPTKDELEDLAESFNKMGKNLKTSREELERQNQKLIELNNVKNNFLSMVSHELRTPLMIIKEAISQVVDGIKGPVPDNQKEFLNMALRNAGRLNQIIQDLLSISKIETGKIKFTRKIINLSDLIESEMNNIRIKSNEKKIELIKEYEDKNVYAYCDVEKIQIILTNLLGNAIKFTKSNGKISVHLLETHDLIKVTVKDTGPGIPKDSLEKIFERFVRLNPTPLIGEPSTGLGLAIAKELTNMHNGNIWAESDGVTGSSFSFTLPKYYDKEFLHIYFQDRINESLDRRLELSLFNIILKINKEKIKDTIINEEKIFSDLKNLPYGEVVESTDVFDIKGSNEIYIFSFSDLKSSFVIKDKLKELISEKFHSVYETSIFNVIILTATLNTDGKTKDEIFNFLNSKKNDI